MQQQLVYKNSLINYYVFGSGAKVLYCFHGYGETSISFAFLEKHLGKDYTLYAIDFPFHGKTEWKEQQPFTPNDLHNILALILPDRTKKFSLLAYSMGGRAAMHLLQQTPGQIESVTLVAPDGLHQNIWYWITTQTLVGNKAFSYTMQNPKWFFWLVSAGKKLNIINDSIAKFVHYYLDDKKQRALLYKRWTFMRKLKPDLKTIKKVCAERNIKLKFLFGKYDQIILSKRAQIFT